MCCHWTVHSKLHKQIRSKALYAKQCLLKCVYISPYSCDTHMIVNLYNKKVH